MVALCEAPSSPHEKQIPKAGFYLSAFLFPPTQHLFKIWNETSTVFHNQISPITRNSQPDQASFSCFSESFLFPLGGPLSLPSVRLNSLMVILIISICFHSLLPLDLQAVVLKAKNRKPFFGMHFLSRGSSADRKVIVKCILGADLHTKHEFHPGSHVRQLLHQQNTIL